MTPEAAGRPGPERREAGRHAVTGAFGYSGRRIARRLLEEGRRVLTLTGHPDRGDALAGKLESVRPFDFRRPGRMARTLEGVDVLQNTFWIRFERGDRTFRWAVRASRALFEAASAAGVGRIVHVSIANPEEGAARGLPYYRGKARVERALAGTGVPHSILRPALLFGRGGVLVNNVAWLVRRSPLFALPGDGAYRLRPIHVDDLAELAVREAARDEDRRVVPAVGPGRPTFRRLVRTLARATGTTTRAVSVPPGAALAAARILGPLVGDRVLTRHELEGLTAGLLDVAGPATGGTRLGAWAEERGEDLGRSWASELDRHYR